MNQSTGFTIEVQSQKKSKCWRIWQQINLERTLGWLLKIHGSWMTLDMLRHSSEVQIRGTSSMNLAIHQLNEQASPKHISTICLEMLEEISREITSHSIEMPCLYSMIQVILKQLKKQRVINCWWSNIWIFNVYAAATALTSWSFVKFKTKIHKMTIIHVFYFINFVLNYTPLQLLKWENCKFASEIWKSASEFAAFCMTVNLFYFMWFYFFSSYFSFLS